MTPAIPRLSRRVWIGGLVLLIGLLITLGIFVPTQGQIISRGSTYINSPEGYSAWYASFTDQAVPVTQWRQPFAELVEAIPTGRSATLLRVQGNPTPLNLTPEESEWIAAGNHLIVLGVTAEVRDVPFETTHPTSVGAVKIATRRRFSPWQSRNADRLFLSDRSGAIVVSSPFQAGRLTTAVTPDLAANAYQNEPGNFAYLTRQILTHRPENWAGLWIDEYAHGYRDPDTSEQATETVDTLLGYFGRSPLALIAMQGLILMLVALWGANRRLGQPVTGRSHRRDTSLNYIDALAGVLDKARRDEFVCQTLGQAEQRNLQMALGLGRSPVDRETLLTAWRVHTGRSSDELAAVLPEPRSGDRPTAPPRNLLVWLGQWAQIRQILAQPAPADLDRRDSPHPPPAP